MLSPFDNLEIEILQAEADVKKKRRTQQKHDHDMGYLEGLRRAHFLCEREVEALRKLLSAQAALIEVKAAMEMEGIARHPNDLVAGGYKLTP